MCDIILVLFVYIAKAHHNSFRLSHKIRKVRNYDLSAVIIFLVSLSSLRNCLIDGNNEPQNMYNNLLSFLGTFGIISGHFARLQSPKLTFSD